MYVTNTKYESYNKVLTITLLKNCLLVSVQMILLIIRLFIYLAFHFFALAIRFYSYLKKFLSQSFGSTIILKQRSIAFQRVVLQCCTIIITPVVKQNTFSLFFYSLYPAAQFG